MAAIKAEEKQIATVGGGCHSRDLPDANFCCTCRVQQYEIESTTRGSCYSSSCQEAQIEHARLPKSTRADCILMGMAVLPGMERRTE